MDNDFLRTHFIFGYVGDRKESPMTTVTRYVVTYIGKDGLRTLADAAQGRYTYATAQEAENRLDAFLTNNSPDTLASRFGRAPAFEVRPVECYPTHFDPTTVYFD